MKRKHILIAMLLLSATAVAGCSSTIGNVGKAKESEKEEQIPLNLKYNPRTISYITDDMTVIPVALNSQYDMDFIEDIDPDEAVNFQSYSAKLSDDELSDARNMVADFMSIYTGDVEEDLGYFAKAFGMRGSSYSDEDICIMLESIFRTNPNTKYYTDSSGKDYYRKDVLEAFADMYGNMETDETGKYRTLVINRLGESGRWTFKAEPDADAWNLPEVPGPETSNNVEEENYEE